MNNSLKGFYRFNHVVINDAHRYFLILKKRQSTYKLKLFPVRYETESGAEIFRESSVEFWLTVFSYYSFSSVRNEYRFYRFFERIDKKIFNDILLSRNLSIERYKEIKSVFFMPSLFARLYENSIPVKYIQMLYLHEKNFLDYKNNSTLSEKFFSLLIHSNVNKNTKKELIYLWIDMDIDAKISFIEYYSDFLERSSKDKRFAEKVLEKARQLRFPIYSKIEKDFKNYMRRLNTQKGLRMEHSLSFEKDHLFISMEIARPEEIDTICRHLDDARNDIKELFELSKKYDNEFI